MPITAMQVVILLWQPAFAVCALLCLVYRFYFLSRMLILRIATIFSIGCLGWDDDEGCSKM